MCPVKVYTYAAWRFVGLATGESISDPIQRHVLQKDLLKDSIYLDLLKVDPKAWTKETILFRQTMVTSTNSIPTGILTWMQ